MTNTQYKINKNKPIRYSYNDLWDEETEAFLFWFSIGIARAYNTPRDVGCHHVKSVVQRTTNPAVSIEESTVLNNRDAKRNAELSQLPAGKRIEELQNSLHLARKYHMIDLIKWTREELIKCHAL